jgi:hypothetical protein
MPGTALKQGISTCMPLAKSGLDAGFGAPVCTENLIRVADVMESPKLAE